MWVLIFRFLYGLVLIIAYMFTRGGHLLLKWVLKSVLRVGRCFFGNVFVTELCFVLSGIHVWITGVDTSSLGLYNSEFLPRG